jgi:hypothetical protein
MNDARKAGLRIESSLPIQRDILVLVAEPLGVEVCVQKLNGLDDEVFVSNIEELHFSGFLCALPWNHRG